DSERLQNLAGQESNGGQRPVPEPHRRTPSAAKPRLFGWRECQRNVQSVADLLDHPFDIEEVDRPLRLAPMRTDRAEHDQRQAPMLAHPLALPMIGAPYFEKRAIAGSVRAIEDDRLQQTGQERKTHRADVFRKSVRDGDRLL